MFVFSDQVFQTMKPAAFLEITRCCWKRLTNTILYYYYYYYYYGCDNDDDNLYIFVSIIKITNTYDNSEEYNDECLRIE